MKQKAEQEVKKSLTTFFIVLLLFFVSSIITPIIIPLIDTVLAEDIDEDSDSTTYLRLRTPETEPGSPQVIKTYKLEPKIIWYDLQTISGVSKLNSKIDVYEEYKFCIKISSDQGWDDIEYIDIKAWFNNGDDST